MIRVPFACPVNSANLRSFAFLSSSSAAIRSNLLFSAMTMDHKNTTVLFEIHFTNDTISDETNSFPIRSL